MPYRPKYSARKSQEQDRQVQCSPFVTLRKTNTFSEPPIPKGESVPAVPYSKGKLADMPHVSWDDEDSGLA